jgi:hypothetical protein
VLERELMTAARARAARRRRRRRRLTITALLGGALLAAATATSAVSGDGPLAEVLGVDRDDPTLTSVRERRGAPRAVVRARAEDGHEYAFVAFHARGGPPPGPSVCFTQTRDDARRIPSLGCASPAGLARELRENGVLGGVPWGGAHSSSLRITKTATGLVPASAQAVILQRAGGPRVEAKLSPPIPVSLEGPTRPARMRAFLAVESHDADDSQWLGGPIREQITVLLPGDRRKRLTSEEGQFFPMTRSSPPEGARSVMRIDARPSPWRSVAYVGEGGSLCNAAAPAGERLIKPTLLQCSTPLAVVNALSRYGAAVYLSNPNPRRERGRGRMAVFGLTRADAQAVTIIDQRGRRFPARLSAPWASAERSRGDLKGLPAGLRSRLAELPQRMRLRPYITSIALPPRPDEGKGLRLEVHLRDGRVLRTGADGPLG